MAAELSVLVERLEKVACRLESVGASSGSAASVDNTVLARFVEDFDIIINGPLTNFKGLGDEIGGDLTALCALVFEAFREEREFLRKVSLCRKPDDVTQILKPLNDKICEVQAFQDKNFNSKQIHHIKCVTESISALGWVTVAPTPKPYVKECANAAEFWGNKILKDFKEKDKKQVEFVKALKSVLTDMQSYIQEHFQTGVVWNRTGIDASQLSGGSTKGTPAPPPPPPVMVLASSSSGGDGADVKNALFASLNKGSNITSGLKKVTKDMQTHKNPSLRANQPVKGSSADSSPGATPSKPAKCELVGKKWEIENQVGNKNIQITETNSKQSVYIYKCVDSVIVVKGKVNAIVLDNCKKTALCFDNAISSVDIVNCQSIQVQVIEKVPTVSIDKTDGCQVYLSNDSLTADIVTAKSSEMNVLFPDQSKDGDFKEVPLPEQYKTKFDGKKMVTVPADI